MKNPLRNVLHQVTFSFTRILIDAAIPVTNEYLNSKRQINIEFLIIPLDIIDIDLSQIFADAMQYISNR